MIILDDEKTCLWPASHELRVPTVVLALKSHMRSQLIGFKNIRETTNIETGDGITNFKNC